MNPETDRNTKIMELLLPIVEGIPQRYPTWSIQLEVNLRLQVGRLPRLVYCATASSEGYTDQWVVENDAPEKAVQDLETRIRGCKSEEQRKIENFLKTAESLGFTVTPKPTDPTLLRDSAPSA